MQSEAFINPDNAAENRSAFRKQFLLYTLLFIITALGVYLCFLYFHVTFLRTNHGNFDGIAQTYPAYASIREYFAALFSGNGKGFWSWSLGLGDDYFELLKSKLANPLTWLIVAVPEKYLDVAYDLVTVFRQYLAGVTFLFFAREVSLNGSQRVAGALCYTFSGWMIVAAGAQGAFLNAAVVLPLLIMGAERLLKGKSPLLFILSVFLFFVSGVTWTYVGGVTAVLYFVLRYFHYNKGKSPGAFLRSAGYYCICGVAGILISSVFAFSMVLSLSDATTSAAYEPHTVVYTLKAYLNWLLSFTSIARTSTYYTYLYMPILCVMVLPLAVKNIRRGSTAAVMAGILFIAAFFPVTGKFFNGFSYSVGRWFFVLVFFLVWAAVETLGQEEFTSKRGLRLMALWLALLGVWNIGVCYLWLKIAALNDACATAVSLLFGFLILLCLWLWKHTDFLRRLTERRRKRLLGTAVILLTMISVMGAENFNVFPWFSNSLYHYARVGGIRENFAQSTQRAAQTLQQQDSSFFRTDQVDGNNDTRVARVQANENLYFGNRSVYMYFSTISRRWLLFNKAMGNNAGYFDRTTSFSNDNRAALDLLTGVKYFLGDSITKRPGASDYAPFGFTYDRTVDGVQVLKNRYSIGLGTTFSGYITESELMKYPPLVREQVLLQAAVVPDESVSQVRGLTHLKASNIRTSIRSLDYRIRDEKNLTVRKSSMTVKGRGGSFTIDVPRSADAANCQLVLSFRGLTRRTNTYEERERLAGRSGSAVTLTDKINRASFVDDEAFTIYASRGLVEKDAMCRKGKNQALTDIDDYNINLGYYKDASGQIRIRIDNLGEYSFRSLKVYAVPMDVYQENAPKLQQNRYRITGFTDDRVKGTVNAQKDSVLFLSILDNPGWKVRIDGKPVSKIRDTDLAFTGVRVSAGKHAVELQYIPVVIRPAVLLTIIGILAIIIIEVLRRRRGARNKQPAH